MAASEHNLVIILARGLASSVATPMFLVNEDGVLVYFNEAAEEVLGQTFAEAGELSPQEWGTMFSPEDPDTGATMSPDELPLMVALKERRPLHQPIHITSLDGQRRTIAITAFPLFARTQEFAGAVAIFWEEAEG